MRKQFGGKIGPYEKDQYSRSKHWDGEKFNNLEETNMGIPLSAMPGLLYNMAFKRKSLEPNQKINVLPFDQNQFLEKSPNTKFIWYGHSTLLFRIKDLTILLDPMLGPNAAPISPFPIRRFNDISRELINDFPEIDILILSHDHYDHLDFGSIMELKSKVKKYYVALGVARNLVSWGIDPNLITEFDWWESQKNQNVRITFTPSRHFSGRGIRDRFKALWGGWVFKTDTENIWFSGDGGYGKHFAEIGDKFGPFDLAFMECGQYNKLWRPIHLFPDESVQAAKDAKVQLIMPVHWGSFTLSDHHWTEPAIQFTSAAKQQEIDSLIPGIGELITLGQSYQNINWWETFDV